MFLYAFGSIIIAINNYNFKTLLLQVTFYLICTVPTSLCEAATIRSSLLAKHKIKFAEKVK